MKNTENTQYFLTKVITKLNFFQKFFKETATY